MATGDDQLCYREQNGNIKPYQPGEEPVVWIPEKAPKIIKQKQGDNQLKSTKITSEIVITEHGFEDSLTDEEKRGFQHTDRTLQEMTQSGKAKTGSRFIANDVNNKLNETEEEITEMTKSMSDVVITGSRIIADGNIKQNEPGESINTIPDAEPGQIESDIAHTITFNDKNVSVCDESKTSAMIHSDVMDVKPSKRTRADFMPNEFTFRHIDEQARKVPAHKKEDLSSIVMYLSSFASSSMEIVRTFYVWITHNINYDTSGYFGRALLQPTDPLTVLQNRVTVCEGYVRLMEAFCREAGIPVVNICGYAKAFGTQPDDDVTADPHNAHAWNAVNIDGDWFLLDVTWGAGYVKRKERRYVPRFNNAYFLTDADVFGTDHFPCAVGGYGHFESLQKWQLVENPLSKQEFVTCVNFDQMGKEFGIKATSNKESVIDVDKEIDVTLEETYVKMLDYVTFIYKDERKLDAYAYTYLTDGGTVNVHITPPDVGTFTAQIYARSVRDGPRANFQPLVKYVINCVKSYENVKPYPFHHTLYGASRDLSKYGIAEVGEVCHVAEEGEVILTVKPTRHVDLLPRLYFQDDSTDLRHNCFVDYSECFEYLNVIVRLPFEGYFKLSLFAIKEDAKTLTPFVTYIIDSKKICDDGLFPITHEHALLYKCCLIVPLTKILKSGNDVTFTVKSPMVKAVKVDDVVFKATDDDVTFEGLFRTSIHEGFVTIEGCDESGVFHSLYTFQINH